MVSKSSICVDFHHQRQFLLNEDKFLHNEACFEAKTQNSCLDFLSYVVCTDAFLTITVFKVNEIKSLASGRKWPRSDKKIPAIRGFFYKKKDKINERLQF